MSATSRLWRRAVLALAGVQRRVPWGVALTFDDGPSPATTPALLDLLRERDVRATFFVLGDQARAHPDLLLRMRAEGHGIGTHARSIEALERDLTALQLVLGRRSRLHRPPSVRVDVRAAWAMRRARLDSWLWTVDGADVVERGTSLHERDVVLLADGASLAVVARVIEAARSRDLDFVAL